jgi:predicted AlkP superfamily phosphohydrolase/phosphomutase
VAGKAGLAARLVIVGLEMGDGPALHRWAQAGLLPNIQSLLKQGRWRWLETTANQLHISAWPSIYTGVVPGEHGVYFTHQPAPGLQGYQRFHKGLYGRPTFWSLLDQAGRTCTVFDPPYAHPEDGFKGRFINDWGSWAHYLEAGSSPTQLLGQLNRCCGAYPLGLEAHDIGFMPLEAVELSGKLVKAVAAKTDAACWLMKESTADLVFVVFGETHAAGHYCWPRGGTAPSRPEESPLFTVYKEVDRAIGRIREAAGDALFMVVSGDACGANNAGWHLLPDVLEKLGYLVTPKTSSEAGGAPPPSRKFDPVKALRDLLPKDFRKSLARRLPTALRDKLAQRVDMAGVDWGRTRAYCLPTDLEGCIRINLKGREPMGVVEPGPQYEALLGAIEASLLELRDPTDGRQLVSRVLRSDVAFPGPKRHYLPDLVVHWNNQRPIGAAASERLGLLSMPSPDPRPGTHTAPAFALFAGGGVPPGEPVQSGSIVDLAPSVMAWLGVEAPAHMQGQVWPELKNA